MNTETNILWLIIALLFLFLLIWFIISYISKRRSRVRDFDLLDGHEFEYYCADLLRKRGFKEVEVTKGSGDYGIDILAERDGVTYAIQCKYWFVSTAPTIQS